MYRTCAGTARECRERVEEQVKAMVREGVSMESKWGAQRKSLESLSHRLATCEATVYAGAGKLNRKNQETTGSSPTQQPHEYVSNTGYRDELYKWAD